MKKMWLLVIVLVCSSFFTYADLGSFPNDFLKMNRLNAYIVVGKDATPLDVISQTNIGLAIVSKTGNQQFGLAKLDSEINSSHNLILIGNPCLNKITAEILGNPTPCDKDFPVGKAYIKYLEKNGFKYVIAAGNSDIGNKKAAEFLAGFENNNLKGDEITIDVANDVQQTVKTETVPVKKDTPAASPSTPSPVTGNAVKETPTQKAPTTNAAPNGQQIVVVEDKGFFRRIWEWFTHLFGK